MEYVLPLAQALLLVVTAIIVWQGRKRISEVTAKFGSSGASVGFKLREAAEEAVRRANGEALARLAALDAQLLPIRERGRHRRADALLPVELLETRVKELEALLATAPPEQRVELGWALRELYHAYLAEARSFWGSGDGYDRARERVLAGLAMLQLLADSGPVGQLWDSAHEKLQRLPTGGHR